MEGSKRKQMPKFGNWDFYNDIPLSGGYFPKDADLFKPSSLPHHHNHRPMKTAEKRRKHQKQQQQEQKKQGTTSDPTPQQHQRQRRHRTHKAVDEDLYKVPPEFLYQKPKRRTAVSDFLRRCIGLSCCIE